jgi:adenylate cyclase
VLSHLDLNDKAITEMEKAIDLYPNYARAFAYMTYLYIRAGRAEEAVTSIEKAMRINPRFPFWYFHARAVAQFSLKRFKAAAADLEKAVERNPNPTWVRTLLAATYAHMGNQDDAEWQTDELHAQGFNKPINDIVESSTLRFPAYRKLYVDGLKKAGLR